MLNPHLNAINNNPECPLHLHHLDNVSKSLTTGNLIKEMSFPSPWNIFFWGGGGGGNHEVKAFSESQVIPGNLT